MGKVAPPAHPDSMVSNLSFAFGPLHSIAASFDAVDRTRNGAGPTKALRERVVGEVRLAGNACVPLLARKLCAASDRQASWAFYLLASLGGERVIREVRSRLRDGALPDARKALLMALLGDLGAPVPDDVVLADPDGLAEASVRELMASLKTEADYRQAAGLIVAHVPVVDLADFVDELVRESGEPALRLLEALLAEGELPRELPSHLRRLKAELQSGGRVRPAPPPVSRIRCRAVAQKARPQRPARPRRRRPPSENLDI